MANTSTKTSTSMFLSLRMLSTNAVHNVNQQIIGFTFRNLIYNLIRVKLSVIWEFLCYINYILPPYPPNLGHFMLILSTTHSVYCQVELENRNWTSETFHQTQLKFSRHGIYKIIILILVNRIPWCHKTTCTIAKIVVSSVFNHIFCVIYIYKVKIKCKLK